MKTLNVDLGERSYPILIGDGALVDMTILSTVVTTSRVAVVSNETVAPLYLERLTTALHRIGLDVTPIILPDGEKFKTWPVLQQIFDVLLESRCERNTPLIALGGGVIGDMAGFAASAYQRGMPFIQVPTTLLSQVDSSVGGKTAINHPLGKNMIGAFYQPKCVISDVSTLTTLPDKELKSGLGEVIKYGLIRDIDFYTWLESSIEALLARDPDALIYAIERSCINKAEVVALDEKENDVRALLNLGHTFGHAIETGMGYGCWLHGHAVAAGTMMAAELAVLAGWLSHAELERIENLYVRAGLPVYGPAVLPVARYLSLMRSDKKVCNGRLKLVVPQGLGHAVVTDEFTPADIETAIRRRSR